MTGPFNCSKIGSNDHFVVTLEGGGHRPLSGVLENKAELILILYKQHTLT